MSRLIVSRLLQAAFTLWIVSVIIFLSARLTGSPEYALMPPDALPAERAAFREVYGLDQPLIVQYARWFGQALQGDLGQSIQYRQPVVDIIEQRLPRSFQLSLVALLMTIILAVPLGVLAATQRGRFWGKTAMAVGVGGLALPSFWLAIILAQIFAVTWRVFPASGMGSWEHYILPGFTIGYFLTAGVMRLVRSGMLEVLDAEYVKLARTKGLSERTVIWKHALRNAMLPVVTFLGYMFSVTIAAALPVEIVFRWPGLGTAMFGAMIQKDFPLLQGIVLVWASILIFINALVDLSYGFLDPRIRIRS
jgi:peptide/nickel transport system permease protein